jgi:peptidoglycan hydrolase-like protein with peptidoglycan-binding domain
VFIPSGTSIIYVRFHEQNGCATDKSVAVPQVLGAQTGPVGKVLGESTAVCKEYITTYIKLSRRNNTADVKRLQEFLNEQGFGPLTVNGVYNTATYNAVKAYQLKESSEILKPWVLYGLPSEKTATGYVYKTTKRWINMTKCPALNLPQPKLP